MVRVSWIRTALGLAAALVGLSALASAQQAAPAQSSGAAGRADLILTGGKVITVDEKFSIAQAVAVRGDRILAVGTNQQIAALAGPMTRRIDLRGRALMPGFIDNHAHYQEEGAYWTLEDRLDGVETRKQAIAVLQARAKQKGPGRWIFTLGGWSPDVFTDDSRPFTRDELDKALPDNPVFLQFSREQYYLNSKAIEATGMETMTDPEIRRDARGRATGIVDGDRVGGILRNASGVLKNLPTDIFESSSMKMLKDFAMAGLTASAGACQYENEYRQWLREGKAVAMRFFCFRTSTGAGRTTDQVIAGIPMLRYFDGDEWLDHVNWGERLVTVPDNVYDAGPTVPAATWNEWGRMAKAVAQAGIPVMLHTTQEWTIEEQLKQIEAFAGEVPVRGKRWTFMHMEQVTPNQLERMRALGMWIAIHPRGVIAGAAFVRRFGERGYAMPNLKAVQESGIHWGFGTDAFEVNQFRPFTTLGWAVTGRLLGAGNGTMTMKYPISREEALVAHTRNNAYFLNRENDLGSIAPGKLADMFIADRDYLTVAPEDIHLLKSVLTIVGGRIVYDAAAETATR
ncbi:MAG: amidohydrolase family protein [Acidobacteria bacterium]|nr:amidohydrolase family protein [Acidobacteriota bacterium]